MSRPASSVPLAQPIARALESSAALARLGERMRESNARHAAILEALPEGLRAHVKPGPLDEAGWSLLHKDVSLYAAEQLISTLADVDCADRDIRNGLVALRRTLVKQRDAGTPWRARDAAEVLAMLDVTAWIGVLGLLDECPVLPAALTAVLERRTTTVSATEFAFISTAAQIGDVRIFMMRLPDLLSR